MAGDWIRMRSDLYRNPKVCLLTDLLMAEGGALGRYVNQHCQRDMTVTRNVMRNAAVGALVAVWGVARHSGKRVGDDLVIRGATVDVVDDIADLQGFGAAMEAVGWLVQADAGVVFPRFFEEFNADPTVEKLAKNAERQRRFRERKAAEVGVTSNVTGNVTDRNKRDGREEKRREEKEEETASAVSCPEPPLPAASGPPVMTFPCVGKGPQEWPLTEAKLAEYRQSFPGVDLDAELRKARQWLFDNKARRKTFEGLPRFLGNWLGKAQNGGRSPPPRGTFETHDDRVLGALTSLHDHQEAGP